MGSCRRTVGSLWPVVGGGRSTKGMRKGMKRRQQLLLLLLLLSGPSSIPPPSSSADPVFSSSIFCSTGPCAEGRGYYSGDRGKRRECLDWRFRLTAAVATFRGFRAVVVVALPPANAEAMCKICLRRLPPGLPGGGGEASEVIGGAEARSRYVAARAFLV